MMTNEEAIQTIKSECYISDLLNLDRTRMVNTALDKAVEALKAEPCEDGIVRRICNSCAFLKEGLHAEPCEDCISRLAALHAVEEGLSYVEVENAIKALPSVKPIAENATTTEDCVSRDNVLDMLNQIDISVYDGDGFQKEEWVAFANHIPSVKPIRPKGKWIHWDENEYGETAECSECKDVFYACDGGRVEDIYNYCPNCGAEMEVEK